MIGAHDYASADGSSLCVASRTRSDLRHRFAHNWLQVGPEWLLLGESVSAL